MMPRFSDRTIAIVRRNVNAMLTDTCRIERESGSRGTMGEPIHDWVVVATGVPYRIITAGKQTRTATQQIGGQEVLLDRPAIVCPAGTDFLVNDRVVDEQDGRVFHVVNLQDGLTDGAFAQAQVTRAR